MGPNINFAKNAGEDSDGHTIGSNKGDDLAYVAVASVPSPIFFFSRSSFRALTRAKTLAAEASDDTVYASINQFDIINQSCEIIKFLTNRKLEIVQKGDTPHERHVFRVLLYLQAEYP